MINDDDPESSYRAQLRDAVEDTAAREADWEAFHARLALAAASPLAELRRRSAGGPRLMVAPGAAWWDYASRAALAAVPLGLAAALLLFTYLRSGGGETDDSIADVPASAVAEGSADQARDAFESVLTGTAAPGAVMATLIPIPAAAYLAESAGGSAR